MVVLRSPREKTAWILLVCVALAAAKTDVREESGNRLETARAALAADEAMFTKMRAMLCNSAERHGPTSVQDLHRLLSPEGPAGKATNENPVQAAVGELGERDRAAAAKAYAGLGEDQSKRGDLRSFMAGFLAGKHHLEADIRALRAKLAAVKASSSKATEPRTESWVAAPRYSKLIKAWYLPSKSDPAIPLFGTITGKGMVDRCHGPTMYDRSDAGMISVKNGKGYLNDYGKQVLRELRHGSSVPNKMCKRWARAVVHEITSKWKLVSIMQLIAKWANRLVPVLGPRHSELPSAQCCSDASNPKRDIWAEPDLLKKCCVGIRDPEQEGSPFKTSDSNYRRRYYEKPPCGCQKGQYANFSPRCHPILPKLPSQGGRPQPGGGLRRHLGEAWGRRRKKCEGCAPPPPGKSSRRRRGGEAHRRRSAINQASKTATTVAKKAATTAAKAAKAAKGGVMAIAQRAIGSLLRKVLYGTPIRVAWRGILQKAADVFFKAKNKRVANALGQIWLNKDFPIVARYTLYRLLDKRAFKGGVFGSLGLDCMFTMFFSSIVTEGTYIKFEHKSDTRPIVDRKDQTAGFDPVIQDGPLKLEIHKCPGNYNSDEDFTNSVTDRSTQNNGCRQNGKGVKPLCTAEFTLDLHFCHEFEKGIDCFDLKGGAGTMLRKSVYSQLSVDSSKTSKNAECRPWFVLLDSGLRVGFSSLSAVFTPWLMRNCMFPKDKHIQACTPGQKPRSMHGSCEWLKAHNKEVLTPKMKQRGCKRL